MKSQKPKMTITRSGEFETKKTGSPGSATAIGFKAATYERRADLNEVFTD
jgi:hypothetical protein